jgi:hypothetical protein
MFYLKPPRHISPSPVVRSKADMDYRQLALPYVTLMNPFLASAEVRQRLSVALPPPCRRPPAPIPSQEKPLEIEVGRT